MAMEEMSVAVQGGESAKGVIVTNVPVTQAKFILGFKPKYLIGTMKYSNSMLSFIYDETVSKTKYKAMSPLYQSGAMVDFDLESATTQRLYSIDDKGFTLDQYWNNCSQFCYYAY